MKIRAEFEVPPHIAKGLLNGTLERVGGVIRFADNKQIVAWLRDGGKMSRNPAKHGSTLLPTLLRAAGMNARTVGVVAGAVTIAGPLLDVAIVAFTISRLTKRIRALEKEIADFHSELGKLFAKQNAAALNTALILAEDFLDTEDFAEQKGMLANVIQGLVNAQQLLLLDIDEALGANELELAGKMIAISQMLSIMEARCLLDFSDEKRATARLNSNVESLRRRVRKLIQKHVRDNSALYFHESVCDDWLERYIQIRAWRRGEGNAWEIVVKEARKDFWNGKAINPKDTFYTEALPQAEELIENFQRFESYFLDLESLDSPTRDSAMLSEEAAQRLESHDDYVLLVDEEALGAVARLSS